jgi:cell fate (sporulation/competence/biofilm development) regulator YmcA (YheA/YmcA/DUF963 family)
VDPLDKIVHPSIFLKEIHSEKGAATMLKGFKRSKSTAFFKHLDKVSAASSTGQVINTFKNEILQKSIN